MTTHQKAYRFRIVPSRAHEQLLYRLAGARRWVWNWALARRKDYYVQQGVGISAAQLSVELTALKSLPETAWLKEADSQALQQTLKDLDRAFINFFERRAKFPRFKSRKTCLPSFRIPQRVKITEGKVYVPKIGWVKIRQSQAIEGQTKSATFKCDTCGDWHVTLAIQFKIPDVALPLPSLDQTVGLDAGLKYFFVLSNDEREPTPQFFRKAQKKLRKAQRQLSRRQQDSKRREKSRKHVARIERKVANQRKDFLHKHSTKLVKRFACICIEDLNLVGLARTKLAKSFNDASHGEFRRQLEYKAAWNRKRVVRVDRFFPSTKRCHICLINNDNLTLKDREWTCSACGTYHDRDHNASCNLKDEGLRLLAVGHTDSENARGALVRPCASEATGVEPRISQL